MLTEYTFFINAASKYAGYTDIRGFCSRLQLEI